ncbi:hypothetical protein NDU88_002037 [Pleurodeles waltl]|uniref:Uncharacterized protein n=1 Tax=Pleurodeles waltl TaxID=8319 RepID=A0AAV7TJH8_PLEWA|nr:hypothetical protein NDU88_002037 [Pleurodeles waltl]
MVLFQTRASRTGLAGRGSPSWPRGPWLPHCTPAEAVTTARTPRLFRQHIWTVSRASAAPTEHRQASARTSGRSAAFSCKRGYSFTDPEVLCLAPRSAETLDGGGTFIAPGEEERATPPPQDQKTLKEPTATLEEEKATLQPNLRCDGQKAARR